MDSPTMYSPGAVLPSPETWQPFNTKRRVPTPASIEQHAAAYAIAYRLAPPLDLHAYATLSATYPSSELDRVGLKRMPVGLKRFAIPQAILRDLGATALDGVHGFSADFIELPGRPHADPLAHFDGPDGYLVPVRERHGRVISLRVLVETSWQARRARYRMHRLDPLGWSRYFYTPPPAVPAHLLNAARPRPYGWVRGWGRARRAR